MKKTVGILAHVDAGKTTFSEQILHITGVVRNMGRVDHGNAFLDSHKIERERGITVFSEEAYFTWNNNEYYWVDTPGHVDFSAEMERTLSILDYAVLIINASDVVQSHTEVIWSLLKDYNIPVFIFVNKLDRVDTDYNNIISDLRDKLSNDIIDITSFNDNVMDNYLIESIAERDEKCLDLLYSDKYDFNIWKETLSSEISHRQIFPVLGGSALKGEGITEFLNKFDAITETDYHSDMPFSAQVYKVKHFTSERVCYIKILSGVLSSKDTISLDNGEFIKVSEMRKYQGTKYTTIQHAEAGDICAFMGTNSIICGSCIGNANAVKHKFHTEPMMSVGIVIDPSDSVSHVLDALRTLEDEDPTLNVSYNTVTGAIDIHVMGAMQLDVLKVLLKDRFSVSIEFGPMKIMYNETITEPVIGIGHYEPLRHYAEVHLRLSPNPRGTGITFTSSCHVDNLTLNWQRLIETHVFERIHKGVLIGAPLTDVNIELLAGRDHLKHTEGGDFRESTYRAIRNALMYSKSIVLEPICRFSLRAPEECYGKIIGDLLKMHAETEPAHMEKGSFTINGEATFYDISKYQVNYMSVTRGRGSISYSFSRYAECHNSDEVIAEANYNPLSDDTPNSVFCAHGAGFTVPWDEVHSYAHIKDAY